MLRISVETMYSDLLDQLRPYNKTKNRPAQPIPENMKDHIKFLRKKKDDLYKVLEPHLKQKASIIDRIMQDVGNIYRQVFHGGDLNGVCSIRFLSNLESIMTRIEECCSITFQGLQVCFQILRTLAPTTKEKRQAWRAIRIVRHYWTSELNLPVTPKAGLLFFFAFFQFKNHLERRWAASNKAVQDYISEIYSKSRRRFKNGYIRAKNKRDDDSNKDRSWSQFIVQHRSVLEMYDDKDKLLIDFDLDNESALTVLGDINGMEEVDERETEVRNTLEEDDGVISVDQLDEEGGALDRMLNVDICEIDYLSDDGV